MFSSRLITFATLVTLGFAALLDLPGCSEVENVEKAHISTLTIFPVTTAGEQRKDVGEALGLVIEKTGFRGIKIAEATFRPGDGTDTDFDRVADSFGSFIEKNPVVTDYALYCEFQGAPGVGVKAVRGVVVDRQGKVVWKDVQTPSTSLFKRSQPKNPMECCVFVTQRLRPMLVMASGKELKAEGEMARLWREKSGVPEDKEFAAMKARQKELRELQGQAEVVVYPIRVGEKVDRDAASHLATLLNERKVCRATVAEESLSFEVKPSSNEQRVLWDMAKTFQSHLRNKAPKADYALYGDYIVGSTGGQVHAVHFVVCTRAGDFVIVDFQNSHHSDFKEIAPKSLEDCNRLAAVRLAEYLD